VPRLRMGGAARHVCLGGVDKEKLVCHFHIVSPNDVALLNVYALVLKYFCILQPSVKSVTSSHLHGVYLMQQG
jgi:hypothetical protein